MAKQLVLNPLTGSFDLIDQVTVAPVGSTPNANASSASNNILTLEPADGTNPGVLTASTQTIGGNKTFTGTIASTNLTSGGHAILDIPLTAIGAANGVAPLDASSKIPFTYLPSVVMQYQGAWDPSTNTPTLSDGTSINGYVYYVTSLRIAAIPGLTDPSMVNFQIGDLIIYSTTVGKWQLVTPAAGVSSVNTAQGAVTVNAINQLTGDVIAGPASQSQSKAATIASIQGTTVSGTTGTVNVVFSASPTLTGTIVGASQTLSGTLVATGAISGSNLTSGGHAILDLAIANNLSDVANKATSYNNISPMTTTGDLEYESSTGVASRLPIGSTGNILTVTGGLPTWSPPATSGTVTSVSVVTANGLAGTVATSTSTPAITLSTTITGILQGNGTAISSATTTGTGNVVLSNSPTLITPALGTPSALIGTNITGTASGLTAGNVTTNANLTGPITSVGNATSVASQTGTGSTFVMNTSPTLITPNIGIATGTVSGNLLKSTGDIDQTTFAASNNISSAADITGLLFANASVRSFEALISVTISATTPLYESFKLHGIQKAAGWNMSATSVGDNSGFTFSITTLGQVQYTSGNYTGFVSASTHFRAISLNV